MPRNYVNKNLQNASFRNEDLRNANFAHSDVRGADFTGANLTGANFTDAKTGLRPIVLLMLFIASFIVSIFSGYLAALAGRVLQHMISSSDTNIRVSGYVAIATIILFIVYSYLRGVGTATRHIIVPVAAAAIIIVVIPYLSGMASGKGVLYLLAAFGMVLVMFVVGTIARGVAGSLSGILFTIVALSGGLFAKTVGGGIGAAIMAISCALISKRALIGAPGFELLRSITSYITAKLGTSFRKSELADANFSHLKVHNSDFTDADLMRANWFGSKKINCVDNTTEDLRKK